MKKSFIILAALIWSSYCLSFEHLQPQAQPQVQPRPVQPIPAQPGYFKIDGQGERRMAFGDFDTNYPRAAMLKILNAMDDGTQMLVRPFNTGATPSIKNGIGMGKAMNIKGKSSLLNQPNLQGRIPYIQDNSYTGRQLKKDQITKIGRYMDKDNLINEFIKDRIDSIVSMIMLNQKIDSFKRVFVLALDAFLFSKKIPEPQRQNTLKYASQRYMALVEKNGQASILTEFITKKKVKVNKNLTNLVETQNFEYIPNPEGPPTTDQIDVLAYTWIKYGSKTKKIDALEVVADMDILTINFGQEKIPEFKEDLSKYYNENQGAFFANRCQDLAFGIGYEVPLVKTYTDRLIKASQQEGLIKHSIEALNYCYPQPYDVGKDFILFSRFPKGSRNIKIVKNENNIIANMIYGWLSTSTCVPINPSWIFKVESAQDSLMPARTNTQIVNIAGSFKDKNMSCPSYELISKIYSKNERKIKQSLIAISLPLRLIPSSVNGQNAPTLPMHQLRKWPSQNASE